MASKTDPPPHIAGLKHLRVLGSGGYSTVHLYEQQVPRREIAVKVMRGPSSDLFQSEAELMARVSSHPAILSLFGAGVTEDGFAYIVMEYCPPPQLWTVARRRPLSIADALRTIIQISGAVETAHRAGIIHRDIKPANILLTAYRRPVLADFGISSVAGDVNQATRGLSVPWAPPEQLIDAANPHPSADVYSLAATCYSLLTGRSPFGSAGQKDDIFQLSRRIISDPVPPLQRPDAPEALKRVLEVAMDKSPMQRYPSALALGRALQEIESSLNLPPTTIDLLQDSLDVPEDAGDDDDSGTRIAVFSRVTAPTQAAPAAPEEDYGVEETEEESPRRSLVVPGLIGAAAIAAAAVGGYVVWSDPGEEKPPGGFATIQAGQAAPLKETAPGPQGLAGELSDDGTVRFTWSAPAADWAGEYQYRQWRGPVPTWETTADTSAVLPAGQTCIEVVAVRDDRQASNPVHACAGTPAPTP